MLGKTHAAAGAATALLVLQPHTPLSVGITTLGGIAGGLLCDIDTWRGTDKKVKALMTAMMVFLGLFFADYRLKSNLFASVWEKLDSYFWLGLMMFFLLFIMGLMSNHRTFTHSLVALFFFRESMLMTFPSFANPLFVGYASHMVLDLFNKKGMQLLYPVKKRVSFGICKSNGKTNDVLATVFFIASIAAAIWMLIGNWVLGLIK